MSTVYKTNETTRTMIVKRVLSDKFGSIMISVLLGLGLAAIFKRVCSGDNCIVVKAPDEKETRDFVYKIDSSCYKYEPHAVPCDGNGNHS